MLDETSAAYTTLTTAPPQYWPDFNPVIWYDTGPGMCSVVTWVPVNGTLAVVQLATSWSAPADVQLNVMS